MVEAKGMSQAQFARLIGIHRQNINKSVFEKSSIDTDLLCVISEVLECNLFDYFKSDEIDDKKEIKATLTIEKGGEKQEKTLRFVFDDNDIEIINKEKETIMSKQDFNQIIIKNKCE